MIEILHFKEGAKFIKLNAAVTNLNVQRNLMCHCGRDKNMEKNNLTVNPSAWRFKFRCLVSPAVIFFSRHLISD
jgi:hypothetical protein